MTDELPRNESLILKGHDGAVLSVRFNPKGTYCVTCGKVRPQEGHCASLQVVVTIGRWRQLSRGTQGGSHTCIYTFLSGVFPLVGSMHPFTPRNHYCIHTLTIGVRKLTPGYFARNYTLGNVRQLRVCMIIGDAERVVLSYQYFCLSWIVRQRGPNIACTMSCTHISLSRRPEVCFGMHNAECTRHYQVA